MQVTLIDALGSLGYTLLVAFLVVLFEFLANIRRDTAKAGEHLYNVWWKDQMRPKDHTLQELVCPPSESNSKKKTARRYAPTLDNLTGAPIVDGVRNRQAIVEVRLKPTTPISVAGLISIGYDLCLASIALVVRELRINHDEGRTDPLLIVFLVCIIMIFVLAVFSAIRAKEEDNKPTEEFEGSRVNRVMVPASIFCGILVLTLAFALATTVK